MTVREPNPVDYIMVGFAATAVVVTVLAPLVGFLVGAGWLLLNAPLWLVAAVVVLSAAAGVFYLVGHFVLEGELP